MASLTLEAFRQNQWGESLLEPPALSLTSSAASSPWGMHGFRASARRQLIGLAEFSLKVYLPVAKDLLHYLEAEHRAAAIRRLDASMLRAFLLARSKNRSSEGVRRLATSLRSFLRFLHSQGGVRNDRVASATLERFHFAAFPLQRPAPRREGIWEAP